MSRIRHAKTLATSTALAVVAVLLTLVLTHTGGAKPRPTPRPQDQGATNEAIREAIKPGNYATAVNIHNPSPVYTVTIYAKAVQDGGTPSAFRSFTMAPDYAREVDCTDIYTLLDHTAPNYTATPFTKGFVVFFANGAPSPTAGPLPLPLDVVGVYTAEPPSVQIPPASTPGSIQTQIPGIALEMLTIAPRLETVPPSTTGAQPLPTGQYYEYAAKFLCGYLPIPTPAT
jgi:hypothetical protein